MGCYETRGGSPVSGLRSTNAKSQPVVIVLRDIDRHSKGGRKPASPRRHFRIAIHFW